MLSFVGKRSLAAIAGMSLALAGLVAIAPTATAAGAKEMCGTGIADNKYDSDLIAWKNCTAAIEAGLFLDDRVSVDATHSTKWDLVHRLRGNTGIGELRCPGR